MFKFLAFSLFVCLIFLTACNSGSDTETTTENDSTAVTTTESTSTPSTNEEQSLGNYLELDADMALEDYIGQNVCIEGTIADPNEVNQHMMKGVSPFGEPEQHVFINYNDGEQTTGYYAGFTMPQDKAPHKFYGTVDKISGAGKGGGTHTEFYLNLTQVK